MTPTESATRLGVPEADLIEARRCAAELYHEPSTCRVAILGGQFDGGEVVRQFLGGKNDE